MYFVLFAFSVILSLCIFLYCFVCLYQSSDWLWRLPPKWLCHVGIKFYSNSNNSCTFCKFTFYLVYFVVDYITTYCL